MKRQWTRRLANNLELVVAEHHAAPVAAVFAVVQVGSLDEGPSEYGMAHAVEHMLFKGTPRLGPGEVARVIEGMGGETNAYTTFDETAYYFAIPVGGLRKALSILEDALFESSFDPSEWEKEREVILEEIRRAEDEPGAVLGRRVFSNFYRGTAASRPIFGSLSSVQDFSADGLRNFHRRTYQPQNMRLIVVGDFEGPTMLDEVAALFATRSCGSTMATRPFGHAATIQGGLSGGRPSSVLEVDLIRKDFSQYRFELAFPGPMLCSVEAPSWDLLASILGGGESARLTQVLREQEGLVVAASSGLYSPKFPGLFDVNAVAHPERLLDAIRRATELLRRSMRLDLPSERELQRAKRSIETDRVYSHETAIGTAQVMSQSSATPWGAYFEAMYLAQLQQTDVGAMANCFEQRLAEPWHPKIVALVPQDCAWTNADVETAFLEGWEAGQRQSGLVPGRSPLGCGRNVRSQGDCTVESVAGVRVAYRQNADSDLFGVVAVTPGGLRLEDERFAGEYRMLAGLWGRASRQMNIEEFAAAIEDTGGSFEGFSGKDTAGFRLGGLADSQDRLLGLWEENLCDKVIPVDAFDSIKRDTLEEIRILYDSPARKAMHLFQENLFGSHPYGRSLLGTHDSVLRIDIERLVLLWQRACGSGQWVVGAVGREPADAFFRRMERIGPLLTGRGDSRVGRLSSGQEPARMGENRIVSEANAREQLHWVYGVRGLSWLSPDLYACDVLGTLLGGHSGLLFQELREVRGLVYSVSPVVSYGVVPGYLAIHAGTAPNKRQDLEAAVFALIEELVKNGVDKARFEHTIEHLVGTHAMDLVRVDAQCTSMALKELYGLGASEFLKYADNVRKVTVGKLQALCKELFSQPAVTVCVGPNSDTCGTKTPKS